MLMACANTIASDQFAHPVGFEKKFCGSHTSCVEHEESSGTKQRLRTVQPPTCFYQSRRAASPHYKFAQRLRHFSVGKSRARRGFSVERSGAKRVRRGAARLMSPGHPGPRRD